MSLEAEMDILHGFILVSPYTIVLKLAGSLVSISWYMSVEVGTKLYIDDSITHRF